MRAEIVAQSKWARFLALASRWTLAVFVALGAALLLVRSLLAADPLAAAAGRFGTEPWVVGASVLGASLFVIAIAALARAKAEALRESDAALWLDLRAGAGGRVITATEVTDASAAAWSTDATRRATAVRERPSLGGRAALGRCAIALAAVALAVWVPVRTQAAADQSRIEALFADRLEDVEEQLEALQEEVALEEEDALELEEKLERLQADAAEDPDLEATYEAIDRLEEELAMRAEEALSSAKDAMQGLEDALQSAGELGQSGTETAAGDHTPVGDQLEAALQAAAELLEPGEMDLASLLPGSKFGELPDMSAEALASMTPEEIAKLSEALKDALEGSLEDLAAAGLLDPSALNLKPYKGKASLVPLTDAELAMLEGEPCPDCGKKPSEKKEGEP